MRRTAAVAFAIVALGCSKDAPEKAPAAGPEVERIGKLADEMRGVARAADAKRTAAILAARTTLGPRADLGACSIKVPIVGTEDVARLGQGEPKDAPVDWRSMRAEQMMVVTHDELPTKQSVRLKHVEEMIAFTQSRLDATSSADTEKWLRYYGDLKNASWEMVIVADRRIDPELAEGGKFREGLVIGNAYVYSYDRDAIVCAAHVVARSSELLRHKPLTLSNGKDFNLVFDLENETFREAARTLVAVGPLEGLEAPAGDGGAGDGGAGDGGAKGAKDAGAPKDAGRDAK